MRYQIKKSILPAWHQIESKVLNLTNFKLKRCNFLSSDKLEKIIFYHDSTKINNLTIIGQGSRYFHFI